ncbi:DUF4932 domain-containing protein [Pedobacter sp. SYP-B3415]|uniref:DUF4932 domain-containing protein n=1 Tax=Pedobacter sp. SYP-B3415 TaxID=2496641 RepID=UPI00101C41A3|nr:DUF4932 domain-containing protein [Pedobacter sp. SYP-B3415]
MNRIAILLILTGLSFTAASQIKRQLTKKVTIAVNTNIETYFIAEKLAIEHIGHYVFSNKESEFAHQPVVYFARQHFSRWKDTPLIKRIAEILRQLRDVQHDNSPQLEYLLYRNEFPKAGFRWPVPKDLPVFNEQAYPGSKTLVLELTDSLSVFYRKAQVGKYLSDHRTFFHGAIAEARKDINTGVFPYMEKWYGQSFAGYELYLMPGMPITEGDDNYRAFGPMLTSPNGSVSAMVFSSSVQLPLEAKLEDYYRFGFDNPGVTRLLTVHEVGHSFVNPQLAKFKHLVLRDSMLFTTKLAKSLENSYIGNWEICLTEHLVRLGEIRIAMSMKDEKEANRLRKLHIQESGFILLPVLEQLATTYENSRKKYPTFSDFLPVIFNHIHQLQPGDIDALVDQNKR